MFRTYLGIAAAILALSPALAAAQSAVSDPAVPGSGYQTQQAPRTSPQPLAAEADPSVPGAGYKIVPPPTPRPDAGPLAADVQDPGKPGDGYRVRSATDPK
jgi:hypothetical protein